MSDNLNDILRDALARQRRDSFDEGFADRAVARWRLSRELSLGDQIARHLSRFTPIAVAAVLVLGFYNMRAASSGPTIDRLLGLTTVTVDAAYDLGSLQ